MSCALRTQKRKHHKLNPNAMPTPSGNNNSNENISVEKVIKGGHNVILASFPIRITVEQHSFHSENGNICNTKFSFYIFVD